MTYQLAISALADPTRRRILELLRTRPQRVADLAALLPVSRPAVSQHLKILCEAGLLEVTPRGASRIYRLKPEGSDELRAWLDQLWGDALQGFQEYVEQEVKDD
jgi:DNA-binding transcriptional ArsR family regulator